MTCERGDYAADLEIARGIPRPPAFPERLDAPEEVETPGSTTIEALAELPRRRSGRDVEGDAGDRRRTAGSSSALVRGDDRLDEARARGRSRRRRPAGDRGGDPSGFGADPGSIGPIGFDGEVVADETL